MAKQISIPLKDKVQADGASFFHEMTKYHHWRGLKGYMYLYKCQRQIKVFKTKNFCSPHSATCLWKHGSPLFDFTQAAPMIRKLIVLSLTLNSSLTLIDPTDDTE